MAFLVRLLINALALLVAAWIVPGIQLGAARGQMTGNELLSLGLVALIFGVVNAIIRPILFFLTLPLTILTLGLFIFVLNALMLLVTSWIAEGMDLGFRVNGFVPALLGALIVSLVSWVLSHLLAGPRTGN
jgi:putative membrane protein